VSDNAFRLLKPEITHQLELEGIEEPSEIQNLAIPAILKGLNTLLIAPTGTGKTLAAVLPVLDLYLSARLGGEGKGISVLYVTPLRALNRDLLRRLTGIAKSLIINLQVRHGDTATRVRVMQAKSPPEILITTPETLQAILPGKRMREHLRSVRWVVIDEIHELAMDKRGIQLSLALERLARITQRELQKIGLSATVGDEEKVARFLVGEGRNVTILKSGDPREPQLVVEYIVPTGDDHKEAARLGIPPAAVGRINRIRELLREHRSSLVFTNTREHAESLGARIHALDERLPVRVHHGSLSKEIREEVEREFESGSLKGVICTSSLELGIDVGAVDFIVQYMSPRQATRLIQRVGRSEPFQEILPCRDSGNPCFTQDQVQPGEEKAETGRS